MTERSLQRCRLALLVNRDWLEYLEARIRGLRQVSLTCILELSLAQGLLRCGHRLESDALGRAWWRQQAVAVWVSAYTSR